MTIFTGNNYSYRVSKAIDLQEEINRYVRLINEIAKNINGNLGDYLSRIDIFDLEDLSSLIEALTDNRIQLENLLEEMTNEEIEQFNSYQF